MDTVQAAKIIALPTAFLISGYQFCLSQSPLPIIQGQPVSVSAPIFASVYNRGVIIAAPAAVIATSGFSYLAYTSKDPTQRKAYVAAATLSVSTLVWTRLFMYGGIERLMEISKDPALQQKTGQNGEALRFLKTWTMQNWIRMGLNLGGAMVGLLATLM